MGNSIYKSSYKGREIDEVIKQVKEKIPKQIEGMEAKIKSLGDTKADTKIVPKKVSQLHNDSNFVTEDNVKKMIDNIGFETPCVQIITWEADD